MNRLMLFAILFFTAQGQSQQFKVRLTPVPVEASIRANITGKGAATATLTGAKLSITGSFEGLQGPATMAQLRHGVATGVRGPTVGDLSVSKAASGSVTGSIDLTREQLEDLAKGRLYIQIHSEKAPEGNLWGWLLH
jgi:hypothetical protein